MMPRVLNFGSLNIDYVYSVEHFVRAGETLAARDRNVFAGGKGLNQSVALARAGARVFHAGCVGRDDGALLIAALEADGIDASYVSMRKGSSGHTIIQVDRTGQNSILLFGGANQTVGESHIEHALGAFEAGDFLVLQNEINASARIAQRAAKKGLRIVYNPSPADDAVYETLEQNIDFLLVNEIEAGMISGEDDADSQLDALARKFPRTTVILTCGARGVYCRENGVTHHHGIYETAVIDTTAAGDTFTGFFIAAVIEGRAIDDALRFASIAAAIAVSRAGAAASIPKRDEVLRSNLTLAKG